MTCKNCSGCVECSASAGHAERIDAWTLARDCLLKVEWPKDSEGNTYQVDATDILVLAAFIQGSGGPSQ